MIGCLWLDFCQYWTVIYLITFAGQVFLATSSLQGLAGIWDAFWQVSFADLLKFIEILNPANHFQARLDHRPGRKGGEFQSIPLRWKHKSSSLFSEALHHWLLWRRVWTGFPQVISSIDNHQKTYQLWWEWKWAWLNKELNPKYQVCSTGCPACIGLCRGSPR